ncbi:MAG: glycerophosphodiester phosphodiesterase [Promethearchaeota archaeon]
MIIAHRGASNIAPENTLKAYKKAIELKADFIELDVHETKDGELVITHDENIHRITGKQGHIKDFSLKQLKSLDFGEGEKIPTLQEVIELIRGNIYLNCEIKVENISQKVIELFKKYQIIDAVIVSSFLHNELLKFQKIEPNLKLASLEPTQYEPKYSWDVKKKMIQFCITNNLFAINPFYHLVNQQFVDFAHNNHVKVFPWTVDSKPLIRRLIKLGVDGIITNDISNTKTIINQEKL